MNENGICEPSATAELLELGVVLGQSHAFGLVAGRCSAAQAEAIRRVREERLYKRCTEKWDDFCTRYLQMSRAEADRVIRRLDEFGPAYFEISQLTRVSPEMFRAIAPAIHDGALHVNGEAIELNPENSRRIAAAVAEMRRAIPPKSADAESASLMTRIRQIGDEMDLQERIATLDRCSTALIEAFDEMAGNRLLERVRPLFHLTLRRVNSEFGRRAAEQGVQGVAPDSRAV